MLYSFFRSNIHLHAFACDSSYGGFVACRPLRPAVANRATRDKTVISFRLRLSVSSFRVSSGPFPAPHPSARGRPARLKGRGVRPHGGGICRHEAASRVARLSRAVAFSRSVLDFSGRRPSEQAQLPSKQSGTLELAIALQGVVPPSHFAPRF